MQTYRRVIGRRDLVDKGLTKCCCAFSFCHRPLISQTDRAEVGAYRSGMKKWLGNSACS